MRIKRIYNNNVVMVEDQKSEEMIVIGKGLAFGKKAGEFLEEDRIEKVFTLAEKASETGWLSWCRKSQSFICLLQKKS